MGFKIWEVNNYHCFLIVRRERSLQLFSTEVKNTLHVTRSEILPLFPAQEFWKDALIAVGASCRGPCFRAPQ